MPMTPAPRHRGPAERAPRRLRAPSQPTGPGPVPRRLGAALLLLAAATLGLLLAPPTQAQANDVVAAPATAGPGLSWSGFGTLGLAQSDQPYTYQRHIRNRPSAERDTLLGLQGDLTLTPQLSATLQLKLAPARTHDAGWELRPSWAFIGWRPGNDWLLRAGRLRVPLYLYSESLDVGETHDMARLPTELYTVVPTNDFDGGYLSRFWTLGAQADTELTADAFAGNARTDVRLWYRDGLPPLVAAGEQFVPSLTRLGGLALSLRRPGLLMRSSLVYTKSRRRDGGEVPVDLPYVALGPGMGYYQVDPSMPGPGIVTTRFVRNTFFSLGAELSWGPGWRLTGEVVRNHQMDTAFGLDATAGYLALFRQVGRFTPYVSVSRIRSASQSLQWYQRLTGDPLPAGLPGAAQINAAQRLVAETAWMADQSSLALGTACQLAPDTKLKLEWLQTRVGRQTRLIDTPAGQDPPHDTRVNVWSVNLSFVF